MRNVRNFWATVDVDGRARPVETGPRAADGSMKINLLFRKQGQIAPDAITVDCRALSDGTLVISGTMGAVELFRVKSER